MTVQRSDAPPPTQPGTRPVVLAGDLPRPELRAALTAGTLERVRRGAFHVPTSAVDGDGGREARALARVAALGAQLTTEFWFSHTTAALLWGCWVMLAENETHITQQFPGSGARDRAVVRHSNELPERERTVLHGRPVTTLERTVVDIASTSRGQFALMVADSALRLGADPAEITRIVRSRAGYRGIARARNILALADRRSESAGESMLRWIIRNSQLPVFAPQVAVETRQGTFRVDLGNPRLKIALEFDGQVKYSGKLGLPSEVQVAQQQRQEALEAEGWIVLRFTWLDLYDPDAVIACIRAALANAATQ